VVKKAEFGSFKVVPPNVVGLVTNVFLYVLAKIQLNWS